MTPHYRGPLPPSLRAPAMMHAGGVSVKLGAQVMGLTPDDYRSRVRDAIKRLNAYGGRIRLEKALKEAYR